MKPLKTLSILVTLMGLSAPLFSRNTVTIVADTSKNNQLIFTAVEHPPAFPGGMHAFSLFLRDNIRYPATARTQNVQGKVFASFVVERDGSLTDIKILRDPGAGLGDEAIRVLQLSPKWTPGTQNNKNVRVQYTVPISFSLSSPPPQLIRPVASTDTLKSGKIFNSVDVGPGFPGGTAAFSTFLIENIRYPYAAKQKNITGRVFVQFVVEPDGSLTDMRVLRDPGEGLGEEAMRVLKLSPKWIPGTQNNKPVRVQYVVPVNFSLN